MANVVDIVKGGKNIEHAVVCVCNGHEPTTVRDEGRGL